MKVKYKSSTEDVSKDGKYRYQLSRTWDYSLPKVMFIMLNPSTATDTEDDKTLEKVVSYAKEWGYGSVLIGNLFAYRCKSADELSNVEEPVGEGNQNALKVMSEQAKTIVCAWGNSKVSSTGNSLDFISKPLHYLELSIDGTPKNPLYLKGNLIPQLVVEKNDKELKLNKKINN